MSSLPGAPIVYYGDEIGMGDNVYLGDRDSVRTPMQWNGDRNAGFSRSNPQQLYLPVVIDPEYHYEALNVEAQQRNSSSLWWWMRRLIALRKMHPVLARGDISFLDPDNPKVLAFNLAVLPQFVGRHAALPQLMLYALTLTAVGVAVLLVVVAAAGAARRVLTSRRARRRLEGAAGLVFLGFATGLAAEH